MPVNPEDEYYRYRRLYNQALDNKIYAERCSNSYTEQKNQKSTQLSNCEAKRTSDKKRLSDVKDILKALEGTGGFFSNDVPSTIEKAGKALKKLGTSFQESFRLTGGSKAADVESCLSVSQIDDGTIRVFRKEKERLESEISQADRTISGLKDSIGTLKSKCSQANSDIKKYNRQANNYYDEMMKWRRKMG